MKNTVKIQANRDGYILPRRCLHKLVDKIIQDGRTLVQQGILVSAIYDIDNSLYRDVFRAIIIAVYTSGDTAVAKRLSRTIVKGVDYIYGLKFPQNQEPGQP